jgi:hypothetical protein
VTAVANTNSQLTFSEVVSRIWNPVFKQCRQLINTVHSREIKLREVDQLFRQYEQGELFDQLCSLYKGMEACDGKTVQDTKWIRTSVDLIKQYWALCKQAKAAATILDLKISLHLTGNFEVIEHVAKQVTESMKDSSLGSIDHQMIDAKSFLEEMTADAWKLECLQVFAKCSNIVEWIRKETKGVF